MAPERRAFRTHGPVPPPETRSEPATEPPTRPQQQADALALLAETALHHALDPGGPRGSGTRWWIPLDPANPYWKRGATFPRKRRGGWRATRAGW
jgi:hypothetical protein